MHTSYLAHRMKLAVPGARNEIDVCENKTMFPYLVLRIWIDEKSLFRVAIFILEILWETSYTAPHPLPPGIFSEAGGDFGIRFRIRSGPLFRGRCAPCKRSPDELSAH